MPCNSEHMSQTNKERYYQETAQLFVYAIECYNQLTTIVDRRLITKDLRKTANEYYATQDYTAELCGFLNKIHDDRFEQIVYNGRDKTARRLADWWDAHREADRIREMKEAEAKRTRVEKILDKLSDDEREELEELLLTTRRTVNHH